MLSKCANPECHAPFHYLRDGRLFRVEYGNGPRLVTEAKPPFKIEYFWLCTQCAGTITLKYEPGKGVTTVPLKPTRRAVAS